MGRRRFLFGPQQSMALAEVCFEIRWNFMWFILCISMLKHTMHAIQTINQNHTQSPPARLAMFVFLIFLLPIKPNRDECLLSRPPKTPNNVNLPNAYGTAWIFFIFLDLCAFAMCIAKTTPTTEYMQINFAPREYFRSACLPCALGWMFAE